ncbi:MAG: hypothetical protein ACI9EF_002145 [Pseudohongiellaceae bacterium]|jgi:hypothetical protein
MKKPLKASLVWLVVGLLLAGRGLTLINRAGPCSVQVGLLGFVLVGAGVACGSCGFGTYAWSLRSSPEGSSEGHSLDDTP